MRPILTSFALLLVAGLSQAQNTEWRVAVGGTPSRDGQSINLGPETDRLLWSGGLNAVVAQQGVAEGGRFFVARMFNINDVLQGTSLVAYNIETGQELWRRSLPVDFPGTDWRNMVTAVRDGVVYATRAGDTNQSFLYALRALDGSTLWRSQDLVDQTTTESLSFASNGDLIVGNFQSVRRVRAVDGTTAWTLSRFSPTSGGSEVAVFADRGYTWEASSEGPRVLSIDLATGARRFRSAGIGGGLVQQLGLLVGRDGTVYAPRTQNNPVTDFFVALTDTGTAFVEKWRYPMGYTPFGSHAQGPDGSVYTYARTSPPTIVRLDPATGSVLSTSAPIPSDFFQPRIAVDASGKVYFTNGAFSNGIFLSLNPDLTTRWSVPIANVNLGGPVIGRDGIVLVCGTGQNVRAYIDALPTGASGFTVFRGQLLGGTLPSLRYVDGDRLSVRNGLVLNAQESPVTIDANYTSPLPSPTTLQVRLVSNVSTAGLSQQVQLFDWTTNAYVTVFTGSASTNLAFLTVTAPNPGRFVRGSDNRVSVRYRYRQTGPVTSQVWQANVDQAVVIVR